MSENEIPPLRFRIQIGNDESRFFVQPNYVYGLLHNLILRILGAEKNADTTPERKRLAQLLRTTVSGALLMVGGKILDLVYGSKDHPKPGKGDDLIEWYSDVFTRLLIIDATRSELHLIAHGGTFGQDIIIDEIRSIPVAESLLQNGAGEETGERDSITSAETGSHNGRSAAETV